MSGKNFAILLTSLFAIGIALALVLSYERPATIGTPYEAFQAHRTAWSSQRPAAYAVSIHRRCFCPLWSVRVKVSGAEVQNLQFLDSSSNISEFADRRYYPRDVDSLFKIVED